MGIVAILILAVLIIAMFTFFKKPNYEIVETRDFSCATLTGFTFKYPVFKGWEVTKVTTSAEGCTVWLSSVGLAAQGIDTTIAPSIAITERPVILNPDPRDHIAPNLAVRTDLKNRNGIYFSAVMSTRINDLIRQTEKNLTYQSAAEFYIPITDSSFEAIEITPPVGYSEAGFNEYVFFKTVIDSFALSDASTNTISMTLEKATQLAGQLINQNAPVEMAIKNVVAKSNGWIFYYDSAEAIKTGDYQKYGVPGNNPLFVGKNGTTRSIPNPNDPLLLSK